MIEVTVKFMVNETNVPNTRLLVECWAHDQLDTEHEVVDPNTGILMGRLYFQSMDNSKDRVSVKKLED